MLCSGSICNSKQLKIIRRDGQIQFKYNMLKLCELPWSSSAYDSVAIYMYVCVFIYPSINHLSIYPLIAFNFPQWISHFTFLLSTEHHRVWIHSSLESRVQGRDTQEDRFQWQNNTEKGASFLLTMWEAICTVKNLFLEHAPLHTIGFLIFYPKFIYLSFLYDYEAGWGMSQDISLIFVLSLLCCPHML